MLDLWDCAAHLAVCHKVEQFSGAAEHFRFPFPPASNFHRLLEQMVALQILQLRYSFENIIECIDKFRSDPAAGCFKKISHVGA